MVEVVPISWEDFRCEIVRLPCHFRTIRGEGLRLMEPERGRSRGGAGLALLGIVWFFGTLFLGYAALYYGLAFAGGPSKNGDLAQMLVYAAIALGVGAPAVGLMAAMLLDNKAGIWVYGLIVLGLAILGVSTASGGRTDHVHKEDPAICTAPPERALEVPGC